MTKLVYWEGNWSWLTKRVVPWSDDESQPQRLSYYCSFAWECYQCSWHLLNHELTLRFNMTLLHESCMKKYCSHVATIACSLPKYTGTWFFLQQQYAFSNDTCMRLNYAVSSILMQNIYSVHGFIHFNVIIYIQYLIYLTLKWMKPHSLPHTCVMSHYCQTMLCVACILL
jgi:hypothetical protein